MQHESVAEIISFLRGNDLPQRHLHLFGILYAVYKSDSIGKPDTMCICDNCRLSENITHDKICALPSDTGQCEQFLKGRRYLSVIPVPQHPHAGADITRLAVSEPTWLYDCFDLVGFCRSQCIYIRILFVEFLHYYIYPGICALSGKPDTY